MAIRNTAEDNLKTKKNHWGIPEVKVYYCLGEIEAG